MAFSRAIVSYLTHREIKSNITFLILFTLKAGEMSGKAFRLLIGMTTLIASAMYILSDLIELISGGFTEIQLYITYVAFVAIPFFLIGLHAIQLPQTGWLSLLGGLAYGTSFIFYASTAIYALVNQTNDYTKLVEELGSLYIFHGTLLVIGGLLFGIAVIKAGVLPKWTGYLLLVGVATSFLLNALSMPALSQVFGSTLRNIAFIGMAISILRNEGQFGSRGFH